VDLSYTKGAVVALGADSICRVMLERPALAPAV
jgi:hypothetical protein